MRNIKGLRVDFDSGEGDFVLPPELKDSPLMLQLDVVGDWVNAIEAAFSDISMRFEAHCRKMTPARYKAEREEKTDHIKAQSVVNRQSLIGAVITAVEEDSNGCLKLTFQDGRTHAFYHPAISSATPLQVSDNLTKPA